jgi:hypothetical protein
MTLATFVTSIDAERPSNVFDERLQPRRIDSPPTHAVQTGAGGMAHAHFAALAALAVPWDHLAGEMAGSVAESPEEYSNTRARLPWN